MAPSENLLIFSEHSDGLFPYEAKLCRLPVFVAKQNGLSKIVAGLSSVLRQLLFSYSEDHPLLGFRQSCLIACAEVSVWTRFCEVTNFILIESTFSPKNKRSKLFNVTLQHMFLFV